MGNTSFAQIEIEAGSVTSGTLSLNLIGNNSSMSYVFPAAFTVDAGATMAVGANVTVVVDSESTFSDAGAMTFSSGDQVTLAATELSVSGTLTANGTQFINGDRGGNITFEATATLGGGGNTFGLPIYVPYNLVPSLAVNTNFVSSVDINAGTLPSGTLLSLNQFGTGPALQYVFSSGFTVAAGATLVVGPNVSVLVQSSTLTDGGALTFATGDKVSLNVAVIAVNGTMSATNDTFTNIGGGSNIAVNSGGQLNASNSTFALANLILNAGSNAQLAVNSIANEFSINSGATINITGNNFSNISNTANQNIVASGNPSATINLANNYWGTINTTQIAAKITDHTTNSSLPTVSYNPPLSTASPAGAVSATTATSSSTTFSSNAQSITLSATVTSGTTKINEGSETFAILNGINIIGTPVTVSVANGVASTSSYTLPAGTAAGTYTIEAIYYGTGSYLGSIDASHTLTIKAAATSNRLGRQYATATYSAVAQPVSLTASVSSAAGSVNGGTVTFTILNGGTTIATATSNTVVNGAAGASVTLPAGTAVNNYTIQAVYSGTVNFGGSSDSSQVLTVNSTATTTTVTSSANPSVVGQFVTFAAAVVASSPGLGTPAGTVTFMDGTTALATETLTGGATTFTASSLALNANSITAVYNGSTNFATSTSTALTQTVSQDGTTSLVFSSANPSASGQAVTFTAVEVAAAPGTGTPTGTVTFKDGTTTLATESLSGGTATYIDTALTNGAHSITAVYSGDANFRKSASTSTVLTQGVGQISSASASFLKQDTTTQGSWIGTYGAQGYDVIGDAASLPGYATVTPSGQSTYVWTTSPNAPQALENPGGTGAIAACWYSSSSFKVDVNLTDGQAHDLELYFLDWDKGGRSEQVQISSAATGAVLDTETVSSFAGGEYLDWQVSGNVVITITTVSGPNAVLNGLFFDPVATTTRPRPATFLVNSDHDDAGEARHRNLRARQGYDVIGDAASLPGYATVTPSGQSNYTWAASTNQPQALQDVGGSGALAACWYAPTGFTVDVDLTDGQAHDLALYFMDWGDNGTRSEQVQISNAATGAVLSTQSVSSFRSGVYLDWKVSGNVLITITDEAGPNAVLSGLFFDPVSSTATATASLIGQNTTTQGSWIGTYGAQGYDVIGDAASLPGYATVTPSGQSTYVWTASTEPTPAALAGLRRHRAASAPAGTVPVDQLHGGRQPDRRPGARPGAVLPRLGQRRPQRAGADQLGRDRGRAGHRDGLVVQLGRLSRLEGQRQPGDHGHEPRRAQCRAQRPVLRPGLFGRATPRPPPRSTATGHDDAGQLDRHLRAPRSYDVIGDAASLTGYATVTPSARRPTSGPPLANPNAPRPPEPRRLEDRRHRGRLVRADSSFHGRRRPDRRPGARPRAVLPRLGRQWDPERAGAAQQRRDGGGAGYGDGLVVRLGRLPAMGGQRERPDHVHMPGRAQCRAQRPVLRHDDRRCVRSHHLPDQTGHRDRRAG